MKHLTKVRKTSKDSRCYFLPYSEGGIGGVRERDTVAVALTLKSKKKKKKKKLWKSLEVVIIFSWVIKFYGRDNKKVEN